ncbi:MAG: SURF1 family protein [Pseudomonadota bacterium]
MLLRLGFWQLDRAAEKQQRQLVYQQQRELPATTIAALMDTQDTAYQSVAEKGYFDNQRYWLLDNRSFKGQNGYQVIMPLYLMESKGMNTLLVNRGWIPASAMRDQLPAIETPTGSVSVSGYLYTLPENALFKQSKSDWGAEWPKRVLSLSLESVKQSLGTEVYPLLLRIDDNSPGALLADWQITNAGPEKHRGYAVQWFAMALALVALYLRLLYKEVKNNRDKQTE